MITQYSVTRNQCCLHLMSVPRQQRDVNKLSSEKNWQTTSRLEDFKVNEVAICLQAYSARSCAGRHEAQ